MIGNFLTIPSTMIRESERRRKRDRIGKDLQSQVTHPASFSPHSNSKSTCPDSFQSVRGRHSCEPNSWTSRNINKEPGLSGEQSRSRKLFHRVVPPLGRTRGADSSIILNRFPRRDTQRSSNRYEAITVTSFEWRPIPSSIILAQMFRAVSHLRWIYDEMCDRLSWETKLHLLVSLEIGSIRNRY